MKYCTQCRAQQEDGEEFCTSCGHKIDIPSVSSVPVSKPELSVEQQKSMTSLYVWLAVIIIFIIFNVWLDSKHTTPISNCRDTSREVQTIRKIDGSVDSVETETVYGCEYPDGSFLPAPDLPREN